MKIRFSSALPVEIDKAFEYHARSGALERLIPPWEKISILRSGQANKPPPDSFDFRSDNSLAPGTEVLLKLNLFGPFSVNWLARHERFEPPNCFSDRQIKGPFAAWNHEHRFETIGAGETRLIDEIEFEPPFGFVGAKLGRPTIVQMLEKTFAYRHRVTRDDLAFQSQLVEADPSNASSKTIAISGSHGLVGSEIVRLLSVLGHRIIRLERGKSQQSPSTQSILWDPQKGLLEPQKLNNIAAVIHLAGVGIGDRRWTAKVKDSLWTSRVDSTQVLVRQLSQLDNPPKAFVTSSGVGFYGSCGDRILKESEPVGSDFLASLAEAWEQASAPMSNVGCRWTAGRLAIVLSPRGGALDKMLGLFRWGLGGRIGSGRQYWSCIGLEDAAAAFVRLALDPNCRGPYNLVAESVTNADFTQELADAVSRPAIFPAPAFVLKKLLGEMADGLLLASTNAVGTKLRESGYRFRHDTLRQILRSNLGLERKPSDV